ncbi:HAD family hydrolase [Burkholderia gladioli]|uniref:HAD family hydrolase n=1 Tax=Burkholderia gladioli TaxID=28095 RepID=UPI003B98753D
MPSLNHLIIFDLDGTLIDTPRAIVETFTATLASLDLPPSPPAAIRATVGLPLAQAFAGLLDTRQDDTRVTAAVERYLELFREQVLPRAPELLFPGVADGLASLNQRGFLLAVATSKFQRSAEAVLTAAGLTEQFRIVVGADRVSHPKPHPESGLLILEHLDIPSHRAFMVGDTTHDVLMAKAADMRSIAVTYGVHTREQLERAEPDWIVNAFSAVMEVLVARAEAA